MMIAHSDNASYIQLESMLAETAAGVDLRSETFQELGIIDPRDRVEATLSVRGYSSLFSALYNATYLSKDYSEEVLRWMAASEFDDGIRAGVPDEITVAHKFGEKMEGGISRQLHDCGIVYYPGNPYSLCVMTMGDNWADLERVIAWISRTVFDEVDSRRIKRGVIEGDG
jgi:beta-lactamase class A